PSPSPTPPPLPAPISTLKLQSFIQLGTPTANSTPIILLQEFGKPALKGNVPPGTVFQVQQKQSTPEAGIWIEVKICSLPNPTDGQPLNGNSPEVDSTVIPPNPGEPLDTTTTPLLKVEDVGWLKEQDVNNHLIPNFTPSTKQKGQCTLAP
ncbi:hypothetical protein, partial [Planktothrix mougeotii]